MPIFQEVRKKKRQATFNKVVNSKEYGSQAKYYLGYMSYEKDDYKVPTNILTKWKASRSTKKKCPTTKRT
jgi:hypothetical protein